MGELVVDMMPDGSSFTKNFGGAPANTAIGLARLGVSVGYMGKVGNDAFGEFMIKVMQDNNVNTEGVAKDGALRTTLAFVSLDERGQRNFTFYKGSHEHFSPSDIKENVLNQAKVFHFGSLMQVRSPSKEATEKALAMAKKNNTFISYDPNYRESLWENKNSAVETILSTIEDVSLLKINQEELELLTGTGDPEKGMEKMPIKNRVVVVTLGEKGCYYSYNGISGFVDGFRVNAVDTTGAGDAFNAGMIYGLLPFIRDMNLDKENLDYIFRQSNLIASMTTTQKGAITSFPFKEEVERYNF